MHRPILQATRCCVMRKSKPHGGVLQDGLIPQRKNEHLANMTATRLLMLPNKRNSPGQCPSLRPHKMGVGFRLLNKLGFVDLFCAFFDAGLCCSQVAAFARRRVIDPRAQTAGHLHAMFFGSRFRASKGHRPARASRRTFACHVFGSRFRASKAAQSRRGKSKIVISPGPPPYPETSERRLHSGAAPVAQGCFEIPLFSGSNPSQSRRIVLFEIVLQPHRLEGTRLRLYTNKPTKFKFIAFILVQQHRKPQALPGLRFRNLHDGR